MDNRVRISYSVPLTGIPSELQRVVQEAREDLMLLVEAAKGLNFMEDFAVSSHRVKMCLQHAAAIEARLADVDQISTGYLEIQNAAASSPEESDVDHPEESEDA